MAFLLDLALLFNNSIVSRQPSCDEDDEVFENVKYETIYLGIESNILAIDDRIDDIESFAFKRSTRFQIEHHPHCSAPSNFKDFTATLYLGKIVFEKNKQGILAPKFIPTTITDSSFEGLNTFWLNEINKKAIPTNKKILEIKDILGGPNAREIRPKKDDHKYLKIHYFRHKDNIVLTKEQIISYFTELHQKNTAFIQNYIDSINKNRGIKAYHLNHKIYDELLAQGILQKDMFKWWSNAPKTPYAKAKLLTLDYLSTLKESNYKMLFKIVLYDELFYAYFALSLKNFIVNFSASLSDGNNLLFNAGAYKKYAHLVAKMRRSGNIDPKTGDYKKELRFENSMFETDEYHRELFFGNNGGLMEVHDDYYEYNKKFAFTSPNHEINKIPKQKLELMSYTEQESYATTFTPSPLGKYYFELSDNKGVYIEFFDRIYPSITNPPKGWSKEMMRKLELKLE